VAFTEADKQKMDNAAADAQNALNDIPDEALKPVANWWRDFVGDAGHKRLGRVLLQYADKPGKGEGKR
jgi:hypothetical protein